MKRVRPTGLADRRAWAAALFALLIGAGACRRSHPAGPTCDGVCTVEVWPGLAEDAANDLARQWEAPWLNGTFRLKQERATTEAARTISSCAGLVGVRESDLQLVEPWEHEVFREKSIRCQAVARARSAVPARVGYLQDVISSNDPGKLLPGAMAPVRDGMPGRDGVWKDVDPTLTFDRAGARQDHRELLVAGAYRGRMTWWAQGDFDRDGVEDVLVFLNLASPTAPDAQNVMRAFILTRRQRNGPVTVSQRLE